MSRSLSLLERLGGKKQDKQQPERPRFQRPEMPPPQPAQPPQPPQSQNLSLLQERFDFPMQYVRHLRLRF